MATIGLKPITKDDTVSIMGAIDKLSAEERNRLLNYLLGGYAYQVYTESDTPLTECQQKFWNDVDHHFVMYYNYSPMKAGRR